MDLNPSEIWTPRPEHLRDANVQKLVAACGVADFDALYRFSIDHPERYWRKVLEFCRIKWRRDYDVFQDLSAGREFPRWFGGGIINWTDTIFALADDPAIGDRPAVIAESEEGVVTRVSYRELTARVAGLGAGLGRLGIVKGDRVGMLIEPGVEAVTTFLALSWLGAIVVPLFSGFGVDPIVARLSQCGARALIATTGFRRRGRPVDTGAVARAARDQCSLEFLILKGTPGASLPVADALDWWSLAATPPPPGQCACAMEPGDPFMLAYTSGTTGKPKGTVHTHGGYPLKIAHDSAIHFDTNPGDVFFWPADMGWVAGALMVTTCLQRGAAMLCYDGAPDYPDWGRMARIIERHRVTHFGSTPTAIRGFAGNLPIATAADLSSLRILVTGGESIDAELFVWFHHHFGGGRAPVINYTGGTEVAGALLSSVVVKPIAPASFNTISLGVVVDVVDTAGQPVTGVVGELAIREPSVGMTQSFWNDDERYLDTYWRTIPGMWIHGDLVVRSAEGYFYVKGRSDDTIKLAGKRFGPAEVEELVTAIPGIADAAAVGIEDRTKGQILVVFVTPAPGAQPDAALPERIATHVGTALGRAFRPARVHVVAELPKTRASKVMRRVIRSVYGGLPPGDLSSLENPSALGEIARVAGTIANS